MPTRVLLEGPAIEPLLAQVRDEYGSRVRIISADKVRSGGVGGFFAKQHYELSVEVPDPTEDRIDMAKRMTADNGQPTLERLLERAESQDRIDEHGAHPGGGFGSEESRSAGMGDTGAAFAELMAGLDLTPGGGRPSPRAKAAGPREERPTVRPFRPATATGAPINGGPTVRPVTPGHLPSLAERIGGFGASTVEEFEPPVVTSPARSAAAAYGLHQPIPAVAPVSSIPVPHAEPASAAVPPPLPVTAPAPVAPPAAAPVEATAPVAAPAPVAVPVAAPAADPIPVVVETPAPVVVPAAPIVQPEPDPVVRNLMSVGMPEAMAGRITGGDTYAGVLSVLAARPAAPGIPDGPGEILVLAGDVNLGVPIARQFLEQIGASENHLLLAAPSTAGTGLHSSRLISTHEVAESRVEKLHSADSAWVVVMDAPVGGTDPIWVNEMCDAIGATAVWAIVDATRKTADTARHLRTLGEVEALVVHGVELTADPASVLGLDLPIYSLDSKPATPHAWAAMLCARIAADVMPMAAVPRRVARTVRQ